MSANRHAATTHRCPQCNVSNLPHLAVCVGCGASLEHKTAIQSAANVVDPLIGVTIAGRYELTAILGDGSMGCVYAADDREQNQEVALKILHAHVAQDQQAAERFRREAEATSKLQHPSIVRVLDYGSDTDGRLYLAMQLLEGPNLLELAEESPALRPRRIVNLLVNVLDALTLAHASQILHRDLKPENIMVVDDADGNETAQVCDFGIAKLLEADGTPLTVKGFVCGTPEYMAPEQAQDEPIDARSDLYALGCVLFRLLVGRPPFQADSTLETITLHIVEPVPSPRSSAPDNHIPVELDRVCQRAMAKRPEDRFPTAAAMKDALLLALDRMGPRADAPLGSIPPSSPKPVAKTPTKTASGMPKVWILGAFGLVTLGWLAWLVWFLS